MGNSMIIKTAIALVLTASLAGGAVYYGTQDEVGQNGEVALDEHPHKQAEIVEETENEEDRISSETDIQEDTASTIDRLLNRNSEDKTPEVSNDISPQDEEEVTVDEKEEDDRSNSTTTETTVTETIEIIEEKDEDVAAQNSFVEADENVINMERPDDLYDFAIDQAERITTPDIRDQAYLDIIDYASKNKDYNRAQSTTSKILKVQMRDKARKRIAISMAQRGMAAGAIEEIEKVEIEESRDIMRLQVLQALIQ